MEQYGQMDILNLYKQFSKYLNIQKSKEQATMRGPTCVKRKEGMNEESENPFQWKSKRLGRGQE